MTNMKNYLKNVVNPEEITGTSKKYEFEFTATETLTYKKTMEVIATNEEDAEDIAEQMCENAEIDFNDGDVYDGTGFDDYECELTGESD